MSLKKAKEYYNNGKTEQAFTQLEQQARGGDAQAMLELSRWYKNGKYVKVSIKKAENWCKKAIAAGETEAEQELSYIHQAFEIYRMVEQGDPLGEYLLAQAYEEGRVLEQNMSLAVAYYRKAMEQENILAISKLEELKEAGEENAQLLFLELGMQKDSELYDAKDIYGLCYDILRHHPENSQALGVLEEGAATEEKEAEFYLGRYMLEFSGEPEERNKGLEYVVKAAETGREEALLILAEIYAGKHGIKRDAVQIAECYRKLHECGNTIGTYELSKCYRQGVGVEESKEKAKELLQLAADKGHEPAVADIMSQTTRWEAEGNNSFLGIGEGRDYEKAVHFYRKAYEKNALSPQGIHNLAFCTRNGLGTMKDVPYAMELYQQAADAGNDQAQYFVGNCYRYGFNGYQKSDQQGVAYYEMSAKQGNADALCALGFCLLHGIGTIKNASSGWICYEKAAEHGSKEAREALKHKITLI